MSDNDIVTIKGTRQGIIISIVEDEPFARVMEVLNTRFDKGAEFFAGSFVSLDLGWREMDKEDLEDLFCFFKNNNLKLMGIISSSLATRKLAESKGLKVIIGRLGLAGHHGRKTTPAVNGSVPPKSEKTLSPSPYAVSSKNEAAFSVGDIKIASEETLMIKKTIRSGQSIEHSGNLVVVGDVNPGAEIKAGGDIIVVGALRGTAHAGRAISNTAPTITALKFQPTQIRIREKMDSSFNQKLLKSKQPVIASLSNGSIEYKIYQ